jgi:NADH-ubiquinone oxidoreductase chain 4
MLLSLLTLPLIGLLLVFNLGSQFENPFMNQEDEGENKEIYRIKAAAAAAAAKQGKVVTLMITSLNLLVSLGIFGLFNFSATQFQFVQEHYNISNFDIYLGVDGISIYFILLTTGIMPIALISN